MSKKPPTPEEIEKRILEAIRQRDEGQQLIAAGNVNLAAAIATARKHKLVPMTRMAQIAGMSREHLYQLQAQHEEAS